MTKERNIKTENSFNILHQDDTKPLPKDFQNR